MTARPSVRSSIHGARNEGRERAARASRIAPAMITRDGTVPVRDRTEDRLRRPPDELSHGQGKADSDDAQPGRRVQRRHEQPQRLAGTHRDHEDRRRGQQAVARSSALPRACALSFTFSFAVGCRPEQRHAAVEHGVQLQQLRRPDRAVHLLLSALPRGARSAQLFGPARRQASPGARAHRARWAAPRPSPHRPAA